MGRVEVCQLHNDIGSGSREMMSTLYKTQALPGSYSATKSRITSRNSPYNIFRLAALHMRQLAFAMFPMEFHISYHPPTQLSILDFSMTDDAVFQAWLYVAAICSTLADEKNGE